MPKVCWIETGRRRTSPPVVANGTTADDLMRRGLVRVTSGPLGTEIKWCVIAPNYASLFFAADWLRELPGPFMLRYFLLGWFEEGFEHAGDAAARINEVVARGDIHLLRRAFVREIDPSQRILAPQLHHAWVDGATDADYAVDCIFEEGSGRFRVDWIGPKSTIARLWGLAPVSYPCMPGGSYDRIVSAAYEEVLKAGRPRYDHVYAAMTTPQNEVVWIPYHRVIVPNRQKGARRGVSVVSEIGKVDFHIL